tara:strand:- start:2815 stop:4215 length:1401 start_codon:yes stop_codon:yes gene_type:complete
MGRFNGNNNQGALRQLLERRNFSVNAYDSVSTPLTPDGDSPREPTRSAQRSRNRRSGSPLPDQLYPRPVRDFNFAERVLYGRINRAHDPIFLKKSNLKTLRNDPSEGLLLQAVSFVADAFDNFVTQWQASAARGRLDLSDDYLVEIEPFRAFVDPDTEYNNYLIDLRNVFLETYLTKKRNEQIGDYRAFVKIYLQFLMDVSATIPITKTAYITSNFAGPMISGLAIDLADLDASNDAIKEEFINSANFGFYKLYARENGFYIDKQVPWRLVADIGSPQMLRYSAPYGFSTDGDILRQCYGRAGSQDILSLQRNIIDTYNALVRDNPVVRIPSSLRRISQCGPQYIRREPITIESAVLSYSRDYWVDKYIDIRYNEQRSRLSEGAISEIRKTVVKLVQNSLNDAMAINYINNNIRNFDAFNGSYAHLNFDRQARENSQPRANTSASRARATPSRASATSRGTTTTGY